MRVPAVFGSEWVTWALIGGVVVVGYMAWKKKSAPVGGACKCSGPAGQAVV